MAVSYTHLDVYKRQVDKGIELRDVDVDALRATLRENGNLF